MSDVTLVESDPNPLLDTVDSLWGAVNLTIAFGQQALREQLMRIPPEMHDEIDFAWHNDGEPLLTTIVTVRALKDNREFLELEMRLKNQFHIVVTLRAMMAVGIDHRDMIWPQGPIGSMYLPLKNDTNCELYVMLAYDWGDI